MSSTTQENLPTIVIGAGPVGLAAASHLTARGITPLVIEAGDDVASNVRDWGHVRLFSPWRYDVDKAAAKLLEAKGWRAPPPEELPTGDDLVTRYLRPLSEIFASRGQLRFGHRVVAITRLGTDKVRTKGRDRAPFVVRVRDRQGVLSEVVARAVIDASGTWATPNPVGASGLPAIGEEELADRIRYGIPDVSGKERARYEGKTTLVVGAGHSAANALLSLVELAEGSPATRMVWSTRGHDLKRVFGGGESDGLPARGALGTRLRELVVSGRLELVTGFSILAITRSSETGTLEVSGLRDGGLHRRGGIDTIIAATGQRPDLSTTRELRLELDPWLESAKAIGPLIDPNEHSCGTVRPHGAVELAHPEPGFFVIGSKSYGRAPTFLLATGYEQARSVVAMLAGDREAATRVELDLPKTGVCSVPRGGSSEACCA
ncbi:MAG: NAD(P)-binding domain-containing protein [Deltaproteobacteria bacterium]|nr:NAD(P)-binding domain-containing protein [Deltaproteobacteria bacterium]